MAAMKLALLNFVIASQAAEVCFSFYNALDTSSKKRICLASNIFFFKIGGNEG